VGIAYRSDHGLGLTVIVWDGVIRPEDWRSHVSQMTADPSWPAGRLGLLDATAADVSLLTEDHIREVAAAFGSDRSKLAGIKYAIVAGEAAHAYALAFQQVIGPMGLVTVVFSHCDIACAWLGITVEDVEPTVEELRLAIRTAERP
jgi:hypothetical protein